VRSWVTWSPYRWPRSGLEVHRDRIYDQSSGRSLEIKGRSGSGQSSA
jgi:hypothetical protein